MLAISGRGPRVVGLDGLRAFAVMLVVAYHFWPQTFPGGFIGVDIFFVLSGFLITQSLRRNGSGTLANVIAFWRNRSRRILPALLPLVALTAALAGLIGAGVLPGIWVAVLGAVVFSSNWFMIVQDTSYFAATSSHPLQHLWSLAVEEQFYLVWPLLLLALSASGPRRRALVPVALGIASGVSMAALYSPRTDPTWLYVNTGTHMFGLAFGSALGLLERRGTRHRLCTAPSRLIATLIGIAFLAALIIATFWMRDSSAFAYQGGLVGATLAATALVWSITGCAPGISRMLDSGPLRVLGQHSYGVYLWHWPLLTLLEAAIPSRNFAVVSLLKAAALALTLLAAYASRRWLEEPVVHNGWRASLRIATGAGWRRSGSVIFAASLLVLSAGAACIASTRPSDAEAYITAGEQYLEHHGKPSEPPFTQSSPRAATEEPEVLPSIESAPSPRVAPSAPTRSGRDFHEASITAVGDSVMLAAAPTLQNAFQNMSIDAVVGRQPGEVLPILRDDARFGRLADTVVVGTGTNGALGSVLPKIRSTIGPARTLILVTVHGNRPWIPEVNTEIESFAAVDPHTRVADWDKAISDKEGLLASDGIHPGPAGAVIYVRALLAAMGG